MDLFKILGHVWVYLYPTLLFGSFMITVFGVFLQTPKALVWFSIFGKTFLIFILFSFFYYLFEPVSGNDKGLVRLIYDFYEWAVYLAFYFFIVGIIVASIGVVVTRIRGRKKSATNSGTGAK